MTSAADARFLSEFAAYEKFTEYPTLEYIDRRGAPWTKEERAYLLHFRNHGRRTPFMGYILCRMPEEVDLELARLGHNEIANGVSAALVMEKYGFSASAYHAVCNELLG